MKKFLSLCLALALAIPLTLPTYASEAPSTPGTNIIESISSHIDTTRFSVELLDSIPDGVVPLKFDTWEDATQWINSLNPTQKFEHENKSTISPYAIIESVFDGENYDFKGDVGWVVFSSLPSGSGSVSKTIDYDVTGLSAQTVTAHHYFEYSNGKVTDWSVYVDIGGIGLATYSSTYEKLERHDLPRWDRYFGVSVGNLGYYLEIGGVPVGFYQALELTYTLYGKPV